jgi:hypothetical protein
LLSVSSLVLLSGRKDSDSFLPFFIETIIISLHFVIFSSTIFHSFFCSSVLWRTLLLFRFRLNGRRMRVEAKVYLFFKSILLWWHKMYV